MRYLILFIMFWIPALAFPAFAGQTDSAAVDSSNIKQQEDDYYIVAIGGVGMTTGALYTWDIDFYNGPAFGAGLEIPLGMPHLFGLEIYPNYWISKKKNNDIFPSEEEYIKVSDNYLSAYSTLWKLKYYIGNKNCLMRLSLDLGVYFNETIEEYDGVELGATLYVNISDNYYVNISHIMILAFPDIDYNKTNGTGPNMLMLNFGYKIRM